MTEQSLDQLRLELLALRGGAAYTAVSSSGDEEEEGSFIASVKRKVAQQQQPSSGQLDNTSIAEAWSRDVQLSQEVKEGAQVAVEEEAETIVLATGNRVSYLGSPIVPSMDNFISGSTDGGEGSSSYLPSLLACAQEVTGIHVDEEDSDGESGQEEGNVLEISADEEDEPEKEEDEDEDDNFNNQSLAALSFRLSSSQRLSNEAENDVCSSDIVVPF